LKYFTVISKLFYGYFCWPAPDRYLASVVSLTCRLEFIQQKPPRIKDL